MNRQSRSLKTHPLEPDYMALCSRAVGHRAKDPKLMPRHGPPGQHKWEFSKIEWGKTPQGETTELIKYSAQNVKITQ